jgi:hypothetical protein
MLCLKQKELQTRSCLDGLDLDGPLPLFKFDVAPPLPPFFCGDKFF